MLNGDTMRYFDHVNMGIATDTPRGLLVPTLFGADTMTLSEIAVNSKKLSSDAVAGGINPELLSGGTFTIKEADVLMREGDILTLGDEKISVLHTPGHTKGSVCFDTGDSLISGDTIFSQGFGRYDLYGGSLSDLKSSLERLMQMSKSESRWLYPGHGEPSTLRSAAEMLKFYF